VIVLPISEKAADYCESVYLYLHNKGFDAAIDRSQGQINKKVRNAQLAQWNYILVAGEEEMRTGTVDVRTRDEKRHGKLRVNTLVDMFNDHYPKPPQKFHDKYAKMWNPDDYKDIPIPEPKPQEEQKERPKKEAPPKKEAAPKKEKQPKKGKQEQKVIEKTEEAVAQADSQAQAQAEEKPAADTPAASQVEEKKE